MSADLICDTQGCSRPGLAYCSDCLDSISNPNGLVADCQWGDIERYPEHCETCTCRNSSHEEGFVACAEHIEVAR